MALVDFCNMNHRSTLGPSPVLEADLTLGWQELMFGTLCNGLQGVDYHRDRGAGNGRKYYMNFSNIKYQLNVLCPKTYSRSFRG